MSSKTFVGCDWKFFHIVVTPTLSKIPKGCRSHLPT